MGKYTDQLRDLQWRLKQVYDPKTAFENVEVGKIMHEVRILEEIMEGKEECGNCDGLAGTECCECGQERECWVCNNTGLVEKMEDEKVTP